MSGLDGLSGSAFRIRRSGWAAASFLVVADGVVDVNCSTWIEPRVETASPGWDLDYLAVELARVAPWR